MVPSRTTRNGIWCVHLHTAFMIPVRIEDLNVDRLGQEEVGSAGWGGTRCDGAIFLRHLPTVNASSMEFPEDLYTPLLRWFLSQATCG